MVINKKQNHDEKLAAIPHDRIFQDDSERLFEKIQPLAVLEPGTTRSASQRSNY